MNKDVSLVGTDGKSVSAAKAVLGRRSPIFCRMFNGDLQESSKNCDSINMNYPTGVLRSVVSYCSTNIKYFMTYSGLHKTDTPLSQSDGHTVMLVQLMDAANYLELFELRDAILDILKRGTFYPCTCAILQELWIRGHAEGEVWFACLRNIQQNPMACLLPRGLDSAGGQEYPGIRANSFPVAESIFRYMEDVLPINNHVVAIFVLKAWNATHCGSATEEELFKLQEFADNIDLECIDMETLAAISPCPLFPMERLYKTFRMLAKKI